MEDSVTEIERRDGGDGDGNGVPMGPELDGHPAAIAVPPAMDGSASTSGNGRIGGWTVNANDPVRVAHRAQRIKGI